MRAWIVLLLCFAAGPALAQGQASSVFECIDRAAQPRVLRYRNDAGEARFGVVVAQEGGAPTEIVPMAAGLALDRALFAEAARLSSLASPTSEKVAADHRAARICAPAPASLPEIDAGERIVVAAGLNYAAHAEEAGGGEVFLFPKPSAPTGPYQSLRWPAGLGLVDYEIELGFVLLESVNLDAIPTEAELDAKVAYFVTNDVSDREPIIANQPLTGGTSDGFVNAKGQPGFLPAGPWMVLGSDLARAIEACGAPGLGLELSVDEGAGPVVRQSAVTDRMILSPREILVRIGEQVSATGLRTHMPFESGSRPEYAAIAVDGGSGPMLPAGSLVLTGTPEGVALQLPNLVGVLFRGLVRLRGLLSQFIVEERERAAEPGSYLKPGDRVTARIAGLGSQQWKVGGAGESAVDPCASSDVGR